MTSNPNTPVDFDNLHSTFSAISDVTRRSILRHLGDGEATVKEVAEPFDMSLPAVSKHIKVLETAGLVNRRKEGTTHYLSLNAEPLKEASDWFEYYKKFWTRNLDQLEQFLLDEMAEETETEIAEDIVRK